jgi:hypothetical protein
MDDPTLLSRVCAYVDPSGTSPVGIGRSWPSAQAAVARACSYDLSAVLAGLLPVELLARDEEILLAVLRRLGVEDPAAELDEY